MYWIGVIESTRLSQQIKIGLPVVIHQSQKHREIDTPGTVTLRLYDTKLSGRIAGEILFQAQFRDHVGPFDNLGNRLAQPLYGESPGLRQGRGVAGVALLRGIAEYAFDQPIFTAL